MFRPGSDLTVLTYGTMVFVAEAAAAESGIDAEIVDLRSLWPLDLAAIVPSVKKTGRCVVVHEATRPSGLGAEPGAVGSLLAAEAGSAVSRIAMTARRDASLRMNVLSSLSSGLPGDYQRLRAA